MIGRTDQLQSIYPATSFGILSITDFHPCNHAAFHEIRQREIKRMESVFDNYARADFVKTEPICRYVDYFKKFKKTYFVLQQIESIFVKQQPFPEAFPVVQALFLSELKHGVLMAACDTDAMKNPFSFDVAGGEETFIGSRGMTITLKAGDMYLRDAEGIVISTIYGQDMRTRVTENSRNILFVIIGVEGIPRNTITVALTDLLCYLQTFDRNTVPTVFDVVGS